MPATHWCAGANGRAGSAPASHTARSRRAPRDASPAARTETGRRRRVRSRAPRRSRRATGPPLANRCRPARGQWPTSARRDSAPPPEAARLLRRSTRSRPALPASPPAFAIASLGRDDRTRLRAWPAVFRDLPALRVGGAVTLGDRFVVEHEVQQEHLADVGTAEIEPRAHHANLVAQREPVAAGEKVRLLA